ncbi:proline reductase-associated electron transfer protein PrdC [Lachnospiraceae bacterium PF1-21]|uniref:Proline reductase-associated electron transfer protein PrdC n=1 Tax=Ohessyouella blattaphilus TaxID=2949333 RepID=A0ABT1EIQ8_9FIRM|nr:proline reductase-associated electron transfer protein PrdC [Ohessyouella blattaphilus]MCP1110583.1 proline reductase-associated electron transfer protein PrdC [Ohessyouella blattaphilus]MCR8563977.1 proline reductase-associated electron transfer protein PrdC [Ohessyouella blattaphilus]MDL2249573.1 proline reductase-associated electron transfer protein PrdC [Lachnospiraceae bacterium OttesenSCG-928-J05]
MGNVQLLLRQHVGAPCAAIVKVGDKVEKGTLIATPTGLGANIHSSVYGEVVEVLEDRIIIKPDEEQPDAFVKIKEGTPLEMIKEAGLVGMGGAGFPTGVKLDTKIPGGAFLVNAAECETGLVHNVRQIEEDFARTLRGLKYAMEITEAAKGIFAIKAKNEKAVAVIREAIKDEPNIFIHLLADIYPSGEERAVIRECLGVTLGVDKLPSAANAAVANVETLLRITEAIEDRKPCFSKNLTVIGHLNDGNKPHVYFDVPVGTSVGELIEKSSGIEEPYGEIILGGPFTGKPTTVDTPITKTTGGIVVTMEFMDLHQAPTGILICACSGNEERMRDVVSKYNGKVCSVTMCKQAVEMKSGALKCEDPGNCPGQAEKVLKMKKDGAEYIVIGNCSDCSNTVMGSAPKMGLKVIHQTDHVMRTIGHAIYRKLRISKQVPQLPNGK